MCPLNSQKKLNARFNSMVSTPPNQMNTVKPSEPRLPSRVSRKGLPCPEVWDMHIPVDDKDDAGFIRVEPRHVREAKKQRQRSRRDYMLYEDDE